MMFLNAVDTKDFSWKSSHGGWQSSHKKHGQQPSHKKVVTFISQDITWFEDDTWKFFGDEVDLIDDEAYSEYITKPQSLKILLEIMLIRLGHNMQEKTVKTLKSKAKYNVYYQDLLSALFEIEKITNYIEQDQSNQNQKSNTEIKKKANIDYVTRVIIRLEIFDHSVKSFCTNVLNKNSDDNSNFFHFVLMLYCLFEKKINIIFEQYRNNKDTLITYWKDKLGLYLASLKAKKKAEDSNVDLKKLENLRSKIEQYIKNNSDINGNDIKTSQAKCEEAMKNIATHIEEYKIQIMQFMPSFNLSEFQLDSAKDALKVIDTLLKKPQQPLPQQPLDCILEHPEDMLIKFDEYMEYYSDGQLYNSEDAKVIDLPQKQSDNVSEQSDDILKQFQQYIEEGLMYFAIQEKTTKNNEFM
jgi:hypothetical protein